MQSGIDTIEARKYTEYTPELLDELFDEAMAEEEQGVPLEIDPDVRGANSLLILTVMTKAEVLEALKKMTNNDRLEVIETASKLIREEMPISFQISSHKEFSLAEAAGRMRPFYEQGSELVVFADQEVEDFYEYEDYA